MSHRINILLQDDTWKTFQSIPKGQRSTVMNGLLRDWSLRQQRGEAFKQIEAITKTMKPVTGSAEEWMRRDRNRHQN